MYDITNQYSLEDIDDWWLDAVERFAYKDIDLLLLGDKCDLADLREVDASVAREYSERKGMSFYETCAKTSDSIELAFLAFMKKLMDKKEAKLVEEKEKENKYGLRCCLVLIHLHSL